MERYTSVFTAKNEDFEVVASVTPYGPDAIPARGDLTSSTPRFYRLLWSIDLMQVLTTAAYYGTYVDTDVGTVGILRVLRRLLSSR